MAALPERRGPGRPHRGGAARGGATGGMAVASWRVWLALVAAAAVAAGCAAAPAQVRGAGGAAGAVDRSQVLYLGLTAPPRGTFHPLLAEDAYDSAVNGLIFEGLLAPGPDGGWEPRLAERYEIGDGGRTVTFFLRRGVRWQDGQPFTAADVAYTLRTLLHPRFPGVRGSGYEHILGARAYMAGAAPDVAGIRVLGPHTLQVVLERPYGNILQALAVPVVPAHVFAGTPPERLLDHPAVRQPVGTGPFRLVRYVPDQFVELERNASYWRGAPRIARVVFRLVNQDLAVAQVLAGELDYARVRPSDLRLLPPGAPVRVVESPSLGYQYLGLNHRHPALADRRVRQALAHAIDRQGLVAALLDGHGEVVNSPFPPGAWAYDPAGLNLYPYDPARAAALLAAAGFAPGKGGWLERDGEPLRLVLRYPAGNKARELAAPAIQDFLRRVGVRVDLEMLEFTTLVRKVFDAADFDLYLLGWSLGRDPDMAALLGSGSRWVRALGWSSPEGDWLLAAAAATSDPARRRALYARWAALVNRELPYLFLYSERDIELVSARVRGLRPDGRGALWNLHELWLDGGR